MLPPATWWRYGSLLPLTRGDPLIDSATLLHRPERHEPVCTDTWDPARVRAEIERIAEDARARHDDPEGWPTHPLDEIGRGSIPSHLYFGAAGVVWGIDWLARQGFCESLPSQDERLGDLTRMTRANLPSSERWSPPPSPAYLLGDLGVSLVRYRHAPTAANADVLYERLLDPERMPTQEMMWGAAGVALALTFLLRQTGEVRWRALLEREVDAVLADWQPSEAGCDLWHQDLYGAQAQVIDSVHGAIGNVHALLLATKALGDPRRSEIARRGSAIATRFAEVHDGLANWPDTWPPGRFGIDGWLLHYCHGAPGFVISLDPIAPGADGALDVLLAQAAELVWRAGPLRKGPGLCHGTAGNGYALLKLWRRSGGERWLERARSFAMHSIAQVEAAREEQGHGRYSLWTGDLGVAVYLAHCLEPTEAGFPTLDFF